MWKVGGIKIERTRALNFLLQRDRKISEKGDFWRLIDPFKGHISPHVICDLFFRLKRDYSSYCYVLHASVKTEAFD